MSKSLKRVRTVCLGALMTLGVGLSFFHTNVVDANATDASTTSFSALSGSLDSVISYATYKGNGTSAPALYTPVIRLYQNAAGLVGGYITATAATGYKISAFSTTSAMATVLDYSVGNATSWTGTKTSVAVAAVYSASGLNTSEVSIGCFGTTSSTRFYVNSLSITYAASADPAVSIVGVPLNINVGASGTLTANTVNAGGEPVTWSSNNACLTINETTGAYTANSIGTATVTASLVVDSVLYTSTGAVNISGPATIAECISISGSLASGTSTGYKVTVGGTISATATSTVTISDGVNSLLVYGTYSPNNAATKGWIINGTISFTGNIQNFGGTPEIISPTLVSYTDSAISYATNSNSSLDAECTALSVTPETWATLAANYAALDSYAQARLSSATSTDANSTEIAEYIARYKVIVQKYGYSNYMGITLSAANIDVISENGNNASLVLIVIIAALGLTAIMAYSIGKKKEEQA